MSPAPGFLALFLLGCALAPLCSEARDASRARLAAALPLAACALVGCIVTAVLGGISAVSRRMVTLCTATHHSCVSSLSLWVCRAAVVTSVVFVCLVCVQRADEQRVRCLGGRQLRCRAERHCVYATPRRCTALCRRGTESPLLCGVLVGEAAAVPAVAHLWVCSRWHGRSPPPPPVAVVQANMFTGAVNLALDTQACGVWATLCVLCVYGVTLTRAPALLEAWLPR